MPALNRMLSAFRYLARADVPFRWRPVRSACPNCAGEWFLSLRPDAFMTRCLGCRANLVNLALIPVVQQHAQAHRIGSAWEMSTYGATLAWLRRNVAEVHASEYVAGAAPGSIVGGIRNEDVQNPSFADASLDLITSNQVFEHVADDVRGFRECHRVLKPGGALAFTIPLYDIPATQQLARLTDGRVEYLAEPEYHDSRRGGPGSALCFWRHSFHDIAARVAAAGFDVQLVPVGLPGTNVEPAYVVYAIKTGP